MNNVHPLIRVGGPILGALLLIYAINAGVEKFQADMKAAGDAARLAAVAAAQEGGTEADAAEAPSAATEATAPTEAATPAETAGEAPAATPGPTEAPTTAPAEDSAPAVRFVEPSDGATVTSPVHVVMEATGVTVEPAGEVHEGAGHFHVVVDVDFVPAGEVIPADDAHLHFGNGATEADIELPPGEHTLRLQFADGAHTALEGDGFRDEITITVVEPTEAETPATPTAETAAPETATPEAAAAPPTEEAPALSQETIDLAIAAMTKTGCGGCHVIPGVEGAVGVVGPNQSNLGAVAGSRIPGYSAEEYIRESILNPNAFIVPECPNGPCIPNIMPQNFGDLLTEEELDAIIAYLASLGVEQ